MSQTFRRIKYNSTFVRARAANRSGFTIVELVVVVGLILLVAAISAAAVNLTINRDKVRAGARQIQSYLEGARDRAIYAKSPRGVRFLIDPTNDRTVTSMSFIQQSDNWTSGYIELWKTAPSSTEVTQVRGFDNLTNSPYPLTNWQDLYNRGLLVDGARIKIPNTPSGTWYTIKNTVSLQTTASAPGSGGPNPPILYLTSPYQTAATNLDPASNLAFLDGGPHTYALELPPTLLPNTDAVLLPKGTVIHLDRSTTYANLEQANATSQPNRGDKLPSAWRIYSASATDPTGFDYSRQMDVMFSARGTVIGPAAQRGIIHLYLGEQKDADRDRLVYWASPATYPTQSAPEYGTLADKYARGDKVVVSIFTRTGAISTHPIASGTDPFVYAETGEVAGK